MQFIPLAIPDVILVEPAIHGDHRGYFLESYRRDLFAENGIDINFVQDNMSSSSYGVVRGLHYQKNPAVQGKLVRVVNGEVFDVAIDIREGSPWYGKWVGQFLSAENKRSMYVPPGFAHGFCVVSEYAEFHYKCTGYYSPENERSVIWNDPAVGIEWPIPLEKVILSEKDANAPILADADNNYVYSNQ
jgi:dTDP-4-dehydrorhamnose 3,5-epimerase